MTFEPNRITKENVLEAIKKIDAGRMQLAPSTKYDVIINGKAYPPKEVMRYAHEIMNGEFNWSLSGGEPTNKLLRGMGFEIKEKNGVGISYYVLGATWDGDDDQSERFYNNGIWENGFSNKLFDEIKGINVGDEVAIKSTFAKRDGSNYLRIKAIGTVINNPGTGKSLSIKWRPKFTPFDLEGYGAYRKTFHRVAEEDIEEIFFHESENTTSTTKTDMISKNVILYGPPGTGKTFNSIDKAVEIADKFRFKEKEHELNKAVFDELRKSGQIEFVTFHQSYSYEDFVVGIRPNIDESTNNLNFRKHYGVFYQISEKARENYNASLLGKGKLISVRELINDLLDRLRGGETIPLKTPTNIPFTIEYFSEQTIQLVYSNGSKNNTLSVETLVDITDNKREYPSSLRSYYYPLKDYLLSQQVDSKSEKEERKNFVLIIDEINRANISKVFGELITLLEDDKRIGEDNELKVTLPNGEKDFGVPPNLYIIGTMNTADKSIALIDIALRRRFEFIGYYPIYDGYPDEASMLLKKLNEAIFSQRKSSDYLIGHAYFMKGQSIYDVISNKIIPLLMEYFSSKTEMVEKIFTDTGWKVSYNITTYSWDISKK